MALRSAVTEARALICDPDWRLSLLSPIQPGFDRVYIHQVGRDQERFFEFYEREILPKLERV
jgi:coenzyme F420-dependent glucose-6-phosphate dehydrogenase